MHLSGMPLRNMHGFYLWLRLEQLEFGETRREIVAKCDVKAWKAHSCGGRRQQDTVSTCQGTEAVTLKLVFEKTLGESRHEKREEVSPSQSAHEFMK